MEVDDKSSKGEGLRQYFITKIEELELIVAEKSQNLRRLQAQRNELNAKGNKCVCSASVLSFVVYTDILMLRRTLLLGNVRSIYCCYTQETTLIFP
jgi:hypothetical protein